jgi:peptide-methionine (S)-S-oxide reductase
MTQTIIFGGGCFWCMEAVFQMLKGVESVMSGYTGGKMVKPTYEAVCDGTTEHVEAIKIEFDPSVIMLDDLLAGFFTSHDPTTLNRQGNDVGTQYRSAVFYTTPEQKEMIEKFIQKLTDDQVFKDPIVTEVKPAEEFYTAEAYHQNYYKNNENKPYCQAVISPKIAKLRKQYSRLLK